MMANSNFKPDQSLDDVSRCVRLIILLDAAENAGLVPLPILRLHALAYMSNVLSPVWDIPVFDGKVLKRRGNPFYPSLQHNLDHLVGMGVVLISNISHVLDDDQHWRLEGACRLNHTFADRILQRVAEFEIERKLVAFVQELAYALSALSDDDLERLATEDATYADPIVDVGNVVDFAEWRDVNYSANAARYFEGILPSRVRATRSEMLHLYAHHLHWRLHGKR